MFEPISPTTKVILNTDREVMVELAPGKVTVYSERLLNKWKDGIKLGRPFWEKYKVKLDKIKLDHPDQNLFAHAIVDIELHGLKKGGWKIEDKQPEFTEKERDKLILDVRTWCRKRGAKEDKRKDAEIKDKKARSDKYDCQ